MNGNQITQKRITFDLGFEWWEGAFLRGKTEGETQKKRNLGGESQGTLGLNEISGGKQT